MNREFDQVLDECLDRLGRGETVEECLATHPDLAESLRSLLLSAREMMAAGMAIPHPAAKIAGRQRLLRERARLAEIRPRKLPFFKQLLRRPAVWVPAAAALIIALTVGILALWPAEERTPMTAGSPSPSQSPPESSASPSPTLLAQTGFLEIRVTDAPAPEVSAVYLTIKGIAVHRSGNDGGWETVLSDPRTFELLRLRGIEEILGGAELGAGRFTQVRLEVLQAQAVIGGRTESAEISSREVKLIGAFEIKPHEKTVLTLDFDAEQSLIITGTGVRFKPTVRLIVGGLPGSP